MELNRRELLAAFLGAPFASTLGCSPQNPPLPPEGRIVGPSVDIGHRIRDGALTLTAAPEQWQNVPVVIVGGGVAGLSAAWRLKRAGFNDFVLLELESQPGGTSRGETAGQFSYPWGAHYLPVPMQEHRALISLLGEMGLLEGTDPEGEPIVAEQFLCRDPQERLFYDGAWQEGLLPRDLDEENEKQWSAFQREVHRFAAWRDSAGRRAFAIPMATGSDDAEITALDRISMANWLNRHGFTARHLRWLVDYSCRDDYGMTLEQTSAWAGLFYFVSRMRKPGVEAQSLMTWPEGNARLVSHLVDQVKPHVRSGVPVCELRPVLHDDKSQVEVIAQSHDGQPVGFRSRQVVFAAPHFLAPYVIRGFREERGESSRQFQYGAWMVANLFLKDRPKNRGFPLAWDNVIYDGPSLGYVVATHQRGVDHGPTVFTYYYPLCNADPRVARERLLQLGWEEWAEVALSDLERAHPDIRRLVTRLDVMRWGHAMIRPRPGFVWSRARRNEAEPFGPIHFAHSDLSGIALFEEAFYRGTTAADAVLARLTS